MVSQPLVSSDQRMPLLWIVPPATGASAANAERLRESIMQRTSKNAVIFLSFIAYPSSAAAIVKMTVAALMFVTASLADTFAR